MCGFAGFIDAERTLPAKELERQAAGMSDAMIHRGPDDSGTFVDPSTGLGIGFRRLSILDLSPLGKQPMRSACGRWVVAYNGEIYNHVELRRELEGHGRRFRGRSDTEILLESVAQWGLVPALSRFNGMFAFALWDSRERLLHLARDRFGEKPLYYGRCGSTFLFGSELKALRRHPSFRGEIDRDSLALFLRHSSVPAPYSIYRGIHKLPAASSLTIAADSLENLPEPSPYWTLKEVALRGCSDPFTGNSDQAVERLDALLRESVTRRMISDVPLGAFLSGGIDSSTVVALMQAASSKPVRTFTIGFDEAGYDEAQDAKAVAKHLKTDHTELYVTAKEAMDVIPGLPAIYDEPFSDASQIPTYLVSKMTRRHVTVALSGDGGDEMFGGYNRYFWGRRLWNMFRHWPGPARSGMARALTGISPGVWDSALAFTRVPSPGQKIHKIAEILRSRSAGDYYLELVSHWRNATSVALGSRPVPTLVSDMDSGSEFSELPHRMMYLDAMSYLQDDILHKVDRASMAVSLECRVPYLDPEVVKFAWSLPLSMKIREGKGKWVLRQVLSRYVPSRLWERPKAGFGVPLDSWLRGPLREWAAGLLDRSRLKEQGFFDPAAVHAKWEEHLSRKRDWQTHLWDVLMFQAWLQQHS